MVLGISYIHIHPIFYLLKGNKGNYTSACMKECGAVEAGTVVDGGSLAPRKTQILQ